MLGAREGNGTPLQYSCLENPMDRRAWQTTAHGVAKSQTRLSTHTLTLMYIPEIWHLGIYHQEVKPFLHTKTCTRMLMIVKTQEQPRCPSASSSTVDIHMMKCYLPVKKNELLIYASRMNLINIMLDIVINERSQMQNTSYCTILFI